MKTDQEHHNYIVSVNFCTPQDKVLRKNTTYRISGSVCNGTTLLFTNEAVNECLELLLQYTQSQL